MVISGVWYCTVRDRPQGLLRVLIMLIRTDFTALRGGTGPLSAQGRRTRSGRSGPDPTNFFAFFFSFEANGFARGLKLNELEHYKLDESKGRCPRETVIGLQDFLCE